MKEEQTLVNDVKQFWSSHPMAYNFPTKNLSKDLLAQIDQKFYKKAVNCYHGDGKKLYSDYINYNEMIKNKSVLEIGYGMGTMMQCFCENGANYFGIDLSDFHFAAAQFRKSMFNLNADVVLGNAESLPYGDNQFDFVFSHGVIHHTPQTEKVCDEIYRVLKPGGKFLVMVYHLNSIRVRWDYHIKHSFFRWQKGLKTFCSIQEALNYHTDNHDSNRGGSPLAKAYTRTTGAKLFEKFKHLHIDVTSNPIEFEKFPFHPFGKLMPFSLRKKISKKWGYFLMINGQK
ncbi:MAG TPA: class I SAM-dependent methyltransferase [bacterium]|nr:class I SAM-dependent methyltransferase [bacterium]HNO10181.1 class I SAM-dependent methyltransferase [bacterium]